MKEGLIRHYEVTRKGRRVSSPASVSTDSDEDSDDEDSDDEEAPLNRILEKKHNGNHAGHLPLQFQYNLKHHHIDDSIISSRSTYNPYNQYNQNHYASRAKSINNATSHMIQKGSRRGLSSSSLSTAEVSSIDVKKQASSISSQSQGKNKSQPAYVKEKLERRKSTLSLFHEKNPFYDDASGRVMPPPSREIAIIKNVQRKPSTGFEPQCAKEKAKSNRVSHAVSPSGHKVTYAPKLQRTKSNGGVKAISPPSGESVVRAKQQALAPEPPCSESIRKEIRRRTLSDSGGHRDGQKRKSADADGRNQTKSNMHKAKEPPPAGGGESVLRDKMQRQKPSSADHLEDNGYRIDDSQQSFHVLEMRKQDLLNSGMKNADPDSNSGFEPPDDDAATEDRNKDSIHQERDRWVREAIAAAAAASIQQPSNYSRSSHAMSTNGVKSKNSARSRAGSTRKNKRSAEMRSRGDPTSDHDGMPKNLKFEGGSTSCQKPDSQKQTSSSRPKNTDDCEQRGVRHIDFDEEAMLNREMSEASSNWQRRKTRISLFDVDMYKAVQAEIDDIENEISARDTTQGAGSPETFSDPDKSKSSPETILVGNNSSTDGGTDPEDKSSTDTVRQETGTLPTVDTTCGSKTGVWGPNGFVQSQNSSPNNSSSGNVTDQQRVSVDNLVAQALERAQRMKDAYKGRNSIRGNGAQESSQSQPSSSKHAKQQPLKRNSVFSGSESPEERSIHSGYSFANNSFNSKSGSGVAGGLFPC